jgi:hypothetical protein
VHTAVLQDKKTPGVVMAKVVPTIRAQLAVVDRDVRCLGGEATPAADDGSASKKMAAFAALLRQKGNGRKTKVAS